MRFKTGKFEGKTTEQVLLTAPDHAQWLIENYSNSPHSLALKKRMNDFNTKPFTVKCHAGCNRTATRATVYWGGNLLYFWCDHCNTSSAGAQGAKLTPITRVEELLRHVDASAAGNRSFKRRMLRQLAEAKGLPKRVGEKQAADFFA